jgi:hypothetical protein
MKVLGMRRNLCHCVCLVFLIPVVYLLCQTGSVWRRYRILSEKSNRQKKLLTVQSVQSVRTLTWHVHTLMWQVHTGDVAASGSDTWQADLDIWAYSWTYPEVTRVTTGRVTRGTDDVSSLRVRMTGSTACDDMARV